MIIDADTWIGHWPFRSLPKRSAGDLLEQMDRLDITKALVGNLNGLLYKDVHESNHELAAELRQQLREAQNAKSEAASEELIGQFGIGFYSVFMVADRVELLTLKAGQSEAIRWESSGDGTYTIEPVDDAPQGTSITLHLKPEDTEDALHDYTADQTIRGLVKKYSDFIAWPIRMAVQRTTPADEEAGTPETVTTEVQTLNSMKALWARSKDEVSTEEYHEFYRHVAHDWTDPLETIPMKGEGTFEFQALLFIPSKAPLDLFVPDARRGVQLYVKKVFIMDRCEELLPDHLRFMRGVIDSEDLPLNISRDARYPVVGATLQRRGGTARPAAQARGAIRQGRPGRKRGQGVHMHPRADARRAREVQQHEQKARNLDSRHVRRGQNRQARLHRMRADAQCGCYFAL